VDGLDAWNNSRIAVQNRQTEEFGMSANSLQDILLSLPSGSTVLDVGCSGWQSYKLAQAIGRKDLIHIGADLSDIAPQDQPANTTYITIPADGEPFATRISDLTVCQHCLEHSSRPIESFRSLARATRPSGLIYVESPSELSCIPLSADDPRGHRFDNFFDDPTHIRPWPPAALYRLAISFGARPLKCGRLSRHGIPSAAILARNPISEATYRYISLKDVNCGVASAMEKFWPK
jgi:SAM-dependent methyltransferase